MALLREWSLDEPRAGLRGDYDSFRAAAGCAALTEALTALSDDRGGHFRALEEAIAQIEAGGAGRPVLWAFVLREVRRAGLLAGPQACADCGARFREEKGERAWSLSPAGGGFLCRGCAGRAGRGPGAALRLRPSAAASARFLASAGAAAAGRLRLAGATASEVERAVRRLAEYHLERAMPALAP
jgi:recombinational DNA repair protein (RecF pathway)